MEAERGRESLPPDCAALAEMLFERLDAGAGRWRLMFVAKDGTLTKWSRQEEGNRGELARFGQEEEPAG